MANHPTAVVGTHDADAARSSAAAGAGAEEHATAAIWNSPVAEVLASLNASPDGLTRAEAARRLARSGPNTLGVATNHNVLWLVVRQFGSPIVLLLIGAAVLSFVVHDPTDASIILAIVVVSGTLGFWQEYNAGNIVAALLAKVQLQATVVRDGREIQIPVEAVVPGDVAVIAAGTGIRADCRVLTSRDLFVNEAALTGESFPVEKFNAQASQEPPAGTPADRTSACSWAPSRSAARLAQW